MPKYNEQLEKLENKIRYVNKQISMEKNSLHKRKLLDDLEVIKLQKQIIVIRQKIHQLENR